MSMTVCMVCTGRVSSIAWGCPATMYWSIVLPSCVCSGRESRQSGAGGGRVRPGVRASWGAGAYADGVVEAAALGALLLLRLALHHRVAGVLPGVLHRLLGPGGGELLRLAGACGHCEGGVDDSEVLGAFFVGGRVQVKLPILVQILKWTCNGRPGGNSGANKNFL